MILYFADRHFNILGQATTHLPQGVKVEADLKTEDVEAGVATFECTIPFDSKTRQKVEEWTETGNYILRSSNGETEVFNIVDVEIDTKKQQVNIYAEDDGLDLLNDVVGAYEADDYYPIADYVERFAYNAGWEVGINEVEGLTRKLSWTNEETGSARLLSLAEAFDGCELSFGFEVNGLQITRKYINIYAKRGQDTGVQLRLNKEIDSITTIKSIMNLATALKATGSATEDSNEPITLLGHEYDDGDFYVDGELLKSRKALEKWSRYLWKDDVSEQLGGHVVKTFTYETTNQAVLCEQTIAELKKIGDQEVNYEVDILKLPENVSIGDRVNIIDDKGELYLSSRVLILETSVSDQTRKATLGEHLIKKDGISAKVERLAASFAKSTVSVQRAVAIAEAAKSAATDAKGQVDKAIEDVKEAQEAVKKVSDVVNTAEQAAAAAQQAATNAQGIVDNVEQMIVGIEQTVTNAQNAANNAYQAATTATQKATEAETAAVNAAKDASEAKTAAGNAQGAAGSAVEKADRAVSTANTAKAEAKEASDIATAAKLDAEQAEKDVAAFGKNLETVEQTMKAEYSRKTDLTEATESLQSQISRNAGKITQNISAITMIDETTNNALTKVQAAQSAATLAQEQADQASEDAETAQAEADKAQAAAESAQNEADTAKAAADTAKAVADEAEAALRAAKEDLATVTSRADATEAEIVLAQQAVDVAQAAATTAQANAKTAVEEAETAQDIANVAVDKATKAQIAANKAANEAEIAQQIADIAKGNAEEAQQKVTDAQAIAITAQEAANTARATADEVQNAANNAYLEAIKAQVVADNAATSMATAEAVLASAQQRLEEIQENANATAEEVSAAQSEVDRAQEKANEARASAEAAQNAAEAAKAAAEEAQTAADEAKAAADVAQAEAKAAQDEVDKALGLVYSLERRITSSETGIEQTRSEIKLFAKKDEVIETLGGYYTREEAEAAISVAFDRLNTLVRGKNGESLMTQTDTGWAFDFAKYLEELQHNTERVAEYDDRIKLSSYVNENGETEPSIEFSEDSTEFKVIITNRRVMFQEGGKTPTYIFDNTLVTENIEVKQELRQGGWVHEIRDNCLCLVWKGVTE